MQSLFATSSVVTFADWVVRRKHHELHPMSLSLIVNSGIPTHVNCVTTCTYRPDYTEDEEVRRRAKVREVCQNMG